MSRHLFTDLQRAALSIMAGFAAPVLILGAVILASYCAGQRGQKTADSIQTLRDTITKYDSVRVVVRDTVTIYKRRVDTVKAKSDALDSAVVIVDDSTLRFNNAAPNSSERADSLITVPPLVVANLVALRRTVATQDTLLRWFERKSAADSLAIMARDNMLALKFDRPLCGKKCGIVIGVAGTLALVKLTR